MASLSRWVCRKLSSVVRAMPVSTMPVSGKARRALASFRRPEPSS